MKYITLLRDYCTCVGCLEVGFGASGLQRQRVVKRFSLKALGELYTAITDELRVGNIETAYRLSLTAKRIIKETGVRRPKWLRFCRNCGMVLVPGLSASIRLRRKSKMKYLVWRCVYCGYINRYPYSGSKD